ncbi:MAG: hypothetical protein EYC68_00380 [Chloroflexota bacterium]|nr:MAG: hypothetical protein EYC68_00380 [Chloroflexota bacterium]
MVKDDKLSAVQFFPLLVIAIGILVTIFILLAQSPGALLADSERAANGKYDWMQFGFDSKHNSNNTLESMLTLGNVAGLQQLYQITLPGTADQAPVYLSDVNTPNGVKDLLFVTTVTGDTIALDARDGTQVWIHNNPAVNCFINGGTKPCFTQSAPAIDPNRQYVYTNDPNGFVHKYNVGNGLETISASWPQTTTLKPFTEKGSSNLSLVETSNGDKYLYVTHASFGSVGDYQGHITTINLNDDTQRVFNAMCSDQTVYFTNGGVPDCDASQAGIWARAGVIYNPDAGKIYASTGNGHFDPSKHYWGDSVLALNPDGTGANGDPLDTYTPSTHQELDNNDKDLGSTGIGVLPTASGNYPHLGVQGGKDGILRLLNLDNLSNSAVPGPGNVGGEVFSLNVPQGQYEVRTMPAVWVNPADNSTWVFVANDAGLSGMQLVIDAQGNPSLVPQWIDKLQGGSSPMLANGVLYFAGTNPSYLGISYFIQARDPVNGNVLWEDATIGRIHWESPIVVNGVLYITDGSNHLTAYGIPSLLTPTITPTSTETQTPTAMPTSTPVPSTPCASTPKAPVLKSPADGEHVKVRQVPLNWSNSRCASRFRVIIRQDSETGALVKRIKVNTSNYLTEPLAAKTKYFWRVKACAGSKCATSGWSSFKVKKNATILDRQE